MDLLATLVLTSSTMCSTFVLDTVSDFGRNEWKGLSGKLLLAAVKSAERVDDRNPNCVI